MYVLFFVKPSSAYEPPYSPSYRLNSIPAVLLQGLYAIKQGNQTKLNYLQSIL